MSKATASKSKTKAIVKEGGEKVIDLPLSAPVVEIELVPFDTFISRLKSRVEVALEKVTEIRKVIADAHPVNLGHEIEWNIDTLMLETEIAVLANNFLEIEKKDTKFSVKMPVDYKNYDATYKAEYMVDVYKTYSEIVLRGRNPVGHYELRKKHYHAAHREIIKLMLKHPGL